MTDWEMEGMKNVAITDLWAIPVW